MYREAIAELSKGMTLSHNWPPIVAELGYSYAASGQHAEAHTMLAELRTQSTTRYVDPYLFAIVYIGLGDKEQAIAYLDKACEDRSGYLPWLKVEPKWDGLRRDPRFADLLRRVRLAPDGKSGT